MGGAEVRMRREGVQRKSNNAELFVERGEGRKSRDEAVFGTQLRLSRVQIKSDRVARGEEEKGEK